MTNTTAVTTYRLDIKSKLTGNYIPYSTRGGHESLEFIQSLSRGLMRQRQSGRIVELPSERLLEEWSFDESN